MVVFFTLILNIMPLYILIAIGYGAGRWLNVDKNSIASLSLFIFLPVMVFGFVADMELKPVYALLPFLVFIVQVVIAFATLAIGRKVFCDNRANLLAMSTSMGNTGFFGLPLDDYWHCFISYE